MPNHPDDLDREFDELVLKLTENPPKTDQDAMYVYLGVKQFIRARDQKLRDRLVGEIEKEKDKWTVKFFKDGLTAAQDIIRQTIK